MITKRQWITTLVLALVAAGSAFFGSTWSNGYQEAAQVAGTTFFGTTSALLVAMGVDPRRKGQPVDPAHLSDEDVQRIAAAVRGVKPL